MTELFVCFFVIRTTPGSDYDLLQNQCSRVVFRGALGKCPIGAMLGVESVPPAY